ncbi:MAG: endonuclease/exonuclease/phosphatase family protein [Gemmataceae bacterium]
MVKSSAMLSFAFWNLMGHQADGRAARMTGLRRHLEALAATCDVDVVLVAESPFAHQEVVDALNGAGAGVYHWPSSTNRRVHVYTRLPTGFVVGQFDSLDERLTIRRLTAGQRSLLLAAVHLPSRLHLTADEQADHVISTVVPEILEAEHGVGHRNTILVGDLNMDPFDRGLTAPQGLNAVPSRELASRDSREVERRERPFFYNPMWGLFGDRTPGPPGGYFYSGRSSVYWHLFDQVLLRPGVMETLKEVVMLDRIGAVSLLTAQGRPRTSDGSDHLPLLFRLEV